MKRSFSRLAEKRPRSAPVRCALCWRVEPDYEKAKAEQWVYASVLLRGPAGGFFCPPCAALEQD